MTAPDLDQLIHPQNPNQIPRYPITVDGTTFTLTANQFRAAERYATRHGSTVQAWIRLHRNPDGTLGEKHPVSKYGPPTFDPVLARRHRAFCVRHHRFVPYTEYLKAVERWKAHQVPGYKPPTPREKAQRLLAEKGLLPPNNPKPLSKGNTK